MPQFPGGSNIADGSSRGPGPLSATTAAARPSAATAL